MQNNFYLIVEHPGFINYPLNYIKLFDWLVGHRVYGISTFVGYLTPNPFL